MNKLQRRAIENHCRLACETLQFPGVLLLGGRSLVLSVNTGYE